MPGAPPSPAAPASVTWAVAHRLACNRYLADAVHKWAFASLRRSAWAREFYYCPSQPAVRATTPPCGLSATAGSRSFGTA